MNPGELEALDLDDVAALLRKTPRMVRNYLKDNKMPFVNGGGGRRFVWGDVLEWYVRYRIELEGNDGSRLPELPSEDDESYEEALRRRTIAEANLKELQLARERGQVVAIADVRKSVERVAASLKTAILAMPTKLTGQVFGVKDRERLRKILDSEAVALCRKLKALGGSRKVDEAGDAD